MILSTWDFIGDRIWLGDACFWSSEEDGLFIKLAPSRYQVEVRVADYGSECRIAGLRAFREGVKPNLGTELGKTWADTGTQGFCDAASFAAATQEMTDDVSEAAQDAGLVAAISLPTGHTMFVVECGFGDGEWPVFDLKDGPDQVGFQVDFIKPGEEFPF
ncbi:MAG: hypothetical protein HONBIEJF_01887 [Fimbriimonadaceae bacterium]|nr:hypothetical protein [Fimbriimonadaceae bacterium]